MENTISTDNQSLSVWHPLPQIRWKKLHDNFDLNPAKVLQQLWQSNNGEQEWRDVPEEY